MCLKQNPKLLLDACSVSVVYPHAKAKQRVPAITDVSLSILAGESVAVLGRNGAGKSTLLRALAGAAPLAAGTVRAQSKPIILGVNSALLGDLSGRDNAYLGCLALGMAPRQAKAELDGIIEFAQLEDAQNRPLRTYSSGMAARLKFSICTARPQEVFVMDEALSVGDQHFQDACRDRLESVKGRSGALLLTSHSLPLLERTCERGVLLEAGKVVFDGPFHDAADLYRASRAAAD